MKQRIRLLLDIQHDLEGLNEEQLHKVSEFISGLAAPRHLKGESLQGIWKGLGFEDMDVETELRILRRESEQQILQRSRHWDS